MSKVIKPVVLNPAFLSAANECRQKLVTLPHNQQVARLYRQGLKNLKSWVIDWETFLDEATKLRERFDENRSVSKAGATRLLNEGQQELYDNTHPDPFVAAYMPGGTLYMRNPPIPLDVAFYGEEYPEDAPKVTFNPDMTVCRKETGKSAVGSVLIDYAKKNME
mmetsp:Transcript_27213/g.30110  ORF Transcript_27213/g.30110 Transcript_27213/m.30110 type:complete len:164 (+) Transcript_27213:2133-2624(+)|eukprot:CAMPEP_0194133606 /NCGR_PEP_ID=MMETSP0152-20130528/3706_1 /TAXON_ID=1049557 /ORGANISM="Thalassiothrix antarctica, Strain L6-D1" /LENGTH=163 /DNA_ID=CAMNT_0038828941 /DNA_START=97 /DNA_END=588 /DNA_ORIENTATION=+